MQSKSKLCWVLLVQCVLEPGYVSPESETMKRFTSMFVGIYSIQSSPIRPVGFRLSVRDIPSHINAHRAYVLVELFTARHNLTHVHLMEILDSNNGIKMYRIAPKQIWLNHNNFVYDERTIGRMAEHDVSKRSHCFFFEYVEQGHQFVSYESGCTSLNAYPLFNITYLELTCDGITFLQNVGPEAITGTVTLKKDMSFRNSLEPRWLPDHELCHNPIPVRLE